MNAQYCFPTYTTGCTSNDFIDNFSTTGGISNITNNGTGCNGVIPNSYVFNNTMNVSQIQGLSFSISVQSGTQWGQGIRVWIDWNQDLDFADPSEDVLVFPSSTSVNIGTVTVPMWAIPGPTRMRVLCRFSTTPAITDYCGTGFTFGECEDYIMNVIAATPCTGTPNAGSASPTNATLCAGQTFNVGLTGATYQGNMGYQWEQSTDGGVTWSSAVGGSGANSPFFQTPTLAASIMYRNIFTCLGSGLKDTSDPMTIIITGPSYASLPFSENFEVWDNYCSTKDVPKATSALNFINSPSTGNNSWRRNDEGTTASWGNPALASYIPGSSVGQYSARFHSRNTALSGNLDLFLDCSQQIGPKSIFFDYINNNSINGGADFLEVLLSTDGGMTFTSQGTFNNSANWQNFSILLNTNSATSVLRFRGVGDNGSWFTGSDIGIDNINVVPDCVGQPIAGKIDSVLACPNVNFTLSTSGSSFSGSMVYSWESAPTAAGPWTLVNQTSIPSTITQIPNATYFRCITQCFTSGLADTSDSYLVNMNTFYFCYCNSQSTLLNNLQNIGNVTLQNAQLGTILNNGIATPLLSNTQGLNYYSSFYNLVPTTIYRDSLYNYSVTAFTQDTYMEDGYANIYIDYNRDGSFDPITELAAGGLVIAPSNNTIGSFTVPTNAQYGLTGMRVVYQVAAGIVPSMLNPCGPYDDGETEDYILNILPPPCKTPPYAGIANIDDPITCPGYSVFLTDTTHDAIFANLTHNWQVSTDGLNYVDVPGATLDTMTYIVNSNTWFRFRTTCNGTSNGYSNPVTVTMSPPFACYGNSQATGGIADISDIGAYIIAEQSSGNNIYAYITGGPHLNNPIANRKRTDYTSFGPMELYTDSTYKISIYHILRSLNHSDAQVTMFIDYNNNQQYDIPSERVFKGIADANNFYLNSSFKTPTNPALGVGTGLRVILNNDLSSNNASNNGVGTYTSGETEDYLVKFKLKPLFPNSILNNDAIQEIGIFPNPASSKVYIGFKTSENMNTKISILSLTGATLLENEHKNINGNFVTEVDLTNFSKGTYFVQIYSSKGKYVRKLVVE